MKKFITRLILFLILFALLIVPFNMIVDPYNIFHADAVRDNGVEPNKNYIKTRFVLKHREEYDSYLLGSSRAGFIDVTKLPDGNWYNLSYSEGVPKEQYETLLALIDGGEIPKQVYLNVDNITFLVDPEYHKGQMYRIAYPYDGSIWDKLGFYVRYLDTITTFESLSVIKNYESTDPKFAERLYSTGCENLNQNLQFDNENTEPYWMHYYEERTEETLEEIKEIKELCEAYDIKLTVFTNPIYQTTYFESVKRGYLIFLGELAQITPFYNFSGMNKISVNTEYYFETSHFKPVAGNMMIDVMKNGASPTEIQNNAYGYYVTEQNVDEFLKILYHQLYSAEILEYPQKK